MPDPIRLAHRVAELAGCSRADAELYIQNGWVSVDGRVVEAPNHPVADEHVTEGVGGEGEAHGTTLSNRRPRPVGTVAVAAAHRRGPAPRDRGPQSQRGASTGSSATHE